MDRQHAQYHSSEDPPRPPPSKEAILWQNATFQLTYQILHQQQTCVGRMQHQKASGHQGQYHSLKTDDDEEHRAKVPMGLGLTPETSKSARSSELHAEEAQDGSRCRVKHQNELASKERLRTARQELLHCGCHGSVFCTFLNGRPERSE